MAKITLPKTAVQTGGTLRDWFIDLISVNNEIRRTVSDSNVIIDDNSASASQKITLTQTNVLDILSEGGEVQEHLMGIRMPVSLTATIVPNGLPYRTNILQIERNFADWFIYGAEVWLKADNSEVVFYTNPAAGLASPADYLTGSQMELIRQLNTSTVTFLTIDEVQDLVQTGWNKLSW